MLYTFAMLGHPVLFFIFTLIIMGLASAIGTWFRRRYPDSVERDSSSFKTLEGAVLGMLGLLLGFSFAMAVSRYDLRRDLEVSEANALGTTWLRAGTLEQADTVKMHELLRQYVTVRLQWVADSRNPENASADLQRGAVLQDQMWAIANASANARRDGVSSQFIATLNESIDNAEKRTAAYENRIPAMAWAILIFIGAVSSFIVGVGVKSRSKPLLALLPVIVASVLMLIRDLDSPQRGFIHIQQQSMERLAEQVGATIPGS